MREKSEGGGLRTGSKLSVCVVGGGNLLTEMYLYPHRATVKPRSPSW